MDKMANFKFWIKAKVEALIKAKEIVGRDPENAKLIEYEIANYTRALQKLEEFEYEYNKKDL